MYAVVIEQADRDPRVVTFKYEAEAMRWRDHYEESTNGQWDSDPNWNNYAREPIEILGQVEAIDLLRTDLAKDIEEFGENP